MLSRLQVESIGRQLKFDLELRYNKVIVDGESATGKSLLVTCLNENIQDMNENGLKLPDYYKNIDVYNFSSKNINIYGTENKLIVLDNYEHLAKKFKGLADNIRVDTKNQYIIMGRNTDDLQLSFNNSAEMVEIDGIFTLKYFEDRWKQ